MSCHSVSSWDWSSILGTLRLRWRSSAHIIPSNGLWSGMSAWRNTDSVKRTRWIGSIYLSSSAKSMKTSAFPCPEIRNPIVLNLMSGRQRVFSRAILSYLFGPFAWLFINLTMRARAFLQICKHSWSCRISILGCHFFTEWIIGAGSFWGGSLKGNRNIFLLGPLPLGLLVLDAFLSFCSEDELGGRIRLCRAKRILVSNFCVTCNSLFEFHTLDWLRHVGALPENRLRRLSCPETRNPNCLASEHWRLDEFCPNFSSLLFTGCPGFDRDKHLRQILFLANFPFST